MKTSCFLKSALLMLGLTVLSAPVSADDQTIGPGVSISDTRVYNDVENGVAPAAYVFDHAVLTSTANVTVVSTYEVVLKPGTRIQKGAVFSAVIRDADGLPNRWEMQYFGDLNQNPGGNFDGDGLTNLQEFIYGTDPSFASSDHDNDGLPDVWEVQYGTLAALSNRDDDNDNDGISNWIEYKLGTDPTVENTFSAGLHYQYDKIGRIVKIMRIPSE
jgi:hypothetical protein